MRWFSHRALGRIAVLTALTTTWLTVGPSVGSAAAQSRVQASKKGHQRILTPLELARIRGAQESPPEMGMIAVVDRGVDGQTGSTFPWEGGVGGLNTVNGNKLTSLSVVGWNGRGGMSVSLTLFHNSLADGNSELGQHWTHSYSIYGVVDPETDDFSVRWGDGLGYKFTKNIDGSFSAPQGMADTLVKDSTGYTLTSKNQVRYRFEGGTGNRRNAIWIKDRSDNQVTIAHNSSDAVTSVTDPTGRVLSFTYSSGKLSSVTDPAGRVFTFTRNGSDELTGVGFPLSTSIGYGYDSSHRITSVTDARGKVWTKGYTSSGNALAWEKNPLNQQTDYAYGSGYATITDPMGRVTQHNYGTGGELESILSPGSRTTSFAYTNYRKTSTTSPSGATGYISYDSVGNVLTQTDALGNVTSFTYNAKNDVVSLTSALGKVVTNAYDSAGRLVSTTDALSHTTSYTLNSYGLMTAVTNALGKTSTVSYDSHGNATSSTDPLSHTTSTTYNVLGMPLTATDATGKTASTTYDNLGRTVSVTAPGSRTSSFTYDAAGHKLTTTNPLGQVNSFVYNDAGQLVSHTDALSRTVSFAYNAAGQKASFTDGRGKVTSYSYNSDGLPSGISYPDSTSSGVTYNDDGQVATATDGRGVVVTSSYNDGGQLTGVSYSDSTPSVSFAFNNDGAKTSMTDGTGTTTYSYDSGGRLTTRTSPQGAVTYGYNSANQFTARTLAGSGLTTFGYDDAGRVTSVTSPSSENTTYSYDNANRKTGTVLGNGSTETDSYSTAGDLVDIWHKTSGGSTISRHEYTIDGIGRRVGESLNGGASSVAYTFDNGGQLTGETRTGGSAYTASYSYDASGNRLSKTLGGTTENYTYDNANKLTAAGGKTYTYDAAGHTTGVSSSSGTVSLAWDGAGRLKTATTSAGTYTYTSNGLGQRVAKSGPGISASYVLGSDAIDAQVLSDGAASYVYAGGLVSEVRGGTSKFYHSDALGTTRAITNSSGSTTDSLTTDAFGMTVSGSGSTPTPFGFAGQAGYQSDPETGLMRLGHRYYDNSTGHFISRDKILDGYNWYAYCGNDPVNARDASGLFWDIVLDVVCTVIDIVDFVKDPSIIGGIGLVGDVIGIVVPFLPAPVIKGAIHALEAMLHLPTPHVPPGGGGIGGGGGGIGGGGTSPAPAPTFPTNPGDFETFIGFPGTPIPDGPTTPGRGKVEWIVPGGPIIFEQHPYHPSAPPYHTDPHWHVGPGHTRYLSGEPIPGY